MGWRDRAKPVTEGGWRSRAKAVEAKPEPEDKGILDAATRHVAKGLYAPLNAVVPGANLKVGAGVNALGAFLASRGKASLGESYDKELAALTDAEKSARENHPVVSAYSEGVGAAAPLALLPQSAPAVGAGMAARAGAGAVTGATQGAVMGLADSEETGVVGRTLDAAKGALIGAPVGAVFGAASPVPMDPRVGAITKELSGPTNLELRAGKQAVKAHRASPQDFEQLQADYGEGVVGDEALAGLKALQTRTPEGKSVVPVFSTPEKLARNWDAVNDAAGQAKGKIVSAVDDADPEGAVGMRGVVDRLRSEVLPKVDNREVRAAYGDSPALGVNERIAGVAAEYAEHGNGRASLADTEGLKTALQKRAFQTGSQKYPSRQPQAIRNDPEIRGLGAMSSVVKDEGEKAVETALGPDVLRQFLAAKDQYGFSEQMGRIAHNAYNSLEASRPAVATDRDLWRFVQRIPGLHGARARGYYAAAQAGKKLPDASGAAEAPAVPVGIEAISEYLRSRGLIK